MANVPSFRFSFRGNIRQNHPFGNHPFVNTKKAHWEIKGRFPKGWFWRMYPRSGFRSGGTSAKTTLLETTLLRTPDYLTMQTRHSDTYPNPYGHSSDMHQCAPRCVWRRFPRGTPLGGTPLTIIPGSKNASVSGFAFRPF